MLKVREEFTSFSRFLDAARERDGEMSLRRAISERFSFLGNHMTVMFLVRSGEDMTESLKEFPGHQCA
jgi:hypothetical protein